MKKILSILIVFVLALIVGWQLRLRIPKGYEASKWDHLVQDAANEFGVEKRFIHAVIASESGGEPSSRSPKGAIGLMQLMPRTALAVAKKVGMNGVSESDISRPEINIHLGTAYLAQLSRKFQGDPVLVLAAYNAGPTRTRQWLWFEPGQSSITAVENRAYPATNSYVRNVVNLSNMND